MRLLFPDQDLLTFRSHAPIVFEASSKPYQDPFNSQKIKFQVCLNKLFVLLNNNDNHPVLLDIKNAGTFFFKDPTTKQAYILEITIKAHMNKLKATTTPSLWEKTWHHFLDFITSIRVLCASSKQPHKFAFYQQQDKGKIEKITQLQHDFINTVQESKAILRQ